MFSSLKMRLVLGLYIFLILSIPVGAYLATHYQNIKSSAKEEKVKPTPIPTSKPTSKTSPAKDLLNASQTNLPTLDDTLSPTPEPSTPTTASSFGPTLSLKAILEGRPADNQATKLFVGIIEGTLSTSPRFLLSFTVDLPSSGTYSNLSLAGLNSGSTYTAILKGSTQIATSSAFVMSPSVTNLNSGNPLRMLTGDLNEDNVINSSDYSILQQALGSTSSSSNWNANTDFNKDGTINTFDLSLLTKNLGKIGASGTWTSPIPVASSSAGISQAVGSPEQPGGYWMWMPK